jgi:hypothetical protein
MNDIFRLPQKNVTPTQKIMDAILRNASFEQLQGVIEGILDDNTQNYAVQRSLMLETGASEGVFLGKLDVDHNSDLADVIRRATAAAVKAVEGEYNIRTAPLWSFIVPNVKPHPQIVRNQPHVREEEVPLSAHRPAVDDIFSARYHKPTPIP